MQANQLTKKPDKSVTGRGLDGTITSFFEPLLSLLPFALEVRRNPIVTGSKQGELYMFFSTSKYRYEKVSNGRDKKHV